MGNLQQLNNINKQLNLRITCEYIILIILSCRYNGNSGERFTVVQADALLYVRIASCTYQEIINNNRPEIDNNNNVHYHVSNHQQCVPHAGFTD